MYFVNMLVLITAELRALGVFLLTHNRHVHMHNHA